MMKNHPEAARRPGKGVVVCCVGVVAALTMQVSRAAHPLITEDTGTQGRGNFQLELTAEHNDDEADGANIHVVQSNAVLAYGARDNVDLLFSLPHKRERSEANDSSDVVSGVGDIGFDLKWRLHERGSLSLALKPGITLPTGDETSGLGSGRATSSLYLVTSFDLAPWAFHIHVGNQRYHNISDERIGRQHISIAGWREVGRLKVVTDLGINSNPDKTASSDPAFFIFGLIYSARKWLDLDVGWKKSVNLDESGRALLGGVALRF